MNVAETSTTIPSQSEQNFSVLREADYGYHLVVVYKAALELDPRLEEVEIVPINHDEVGVAKARPAWRSDTGKHQVHMGITDTGRSLQKMVTAMDRIPGASDLFAGIIGIDGDQLTPEIMYVFALAHELGHIREYMDHENDPGLLEARDRDDMTALPIGRVTVSAIMHTGSKANAYVQRNWPAISGMLGVGTFGELLEKQHAAYRGTTAERLADDFASKVLAMNPTTIDQLTGPDPDSYKNLSAEVYG